MGFSRFVGILAVLLALSAQGASAQKSVIQSKQSIKVDRGSLLHEMARDGVKSALSFSGLNPAIPEGILPDHLDVPISHWPEAWPREKIRYIIRRPGEFWDGRMDMQCLPLDTDPNDYKCGESYPCAQCTVEVGKNPIPLFPFMPDLTWKFTVMCQVACTSS